MFDGIGPKPHWHQRKNKIYNASNYKLADNQSDNHQPKSYKKWLIILAILLLPIILAVSWYFFNVNIAIGHSNQNQAFEIISGETTLDIAQNLKDKKLIRGTYSFGLYVYFNNFKLVPGIYYLRQNMNFAQILDLISKGKVQENKITIIEGLRREEIANLLEKNNIAAMQDFLRESEGKEGYLFPDTYRIAVDATAKDIVKIMTDNFQTRTQGLEVDIDDLILASIIEREAKHDEDRPKIAGVYLNRLSKKMKLEADPTVQYGKGSWEPISVSDYTNIKSPYNTYLNKGLPPAPICNPGLDSIKAAVNPEKNDYYYFVSMSDGTTLYAKTLEEHNQNKQQLK